MTTIVRIGVNNGTVERQKKAVHAAVLLQSVINTQEFKDAILSFVNNKRKIEFASNRGLTNIKVYEVLMSGKEILNPMLDYSWDFSVTFYTGKKFSKVIGYTYPNINYINSNTRFFDKMQIWDIAGNYAHEYCHKLGFGHKTASEKDSIPYAVGYIIRDLCEKYVRELAKKEKPVLIN